MFLEGMNFQVGNVKGELQVYIGTQKNDQLFWYGYSEWVNTYLDMISCIDL